MISNNPNNFFNEEDEVVSRDKMESRNYYDEIEES